MFCMLLSSNTFLWQGIQSETSFLPPRSRAPSQKEGILPDKPRTNDHFDAVTPLKQNEIGETRN